MGMARETVVQPQPHEIESGLLGVLLTAESSRGGAIALLDGLRPLLEDAPAALAVRDRDGLTLHVLAETGTPRQWPRTLAPQLALGGQPGVDPATSALVV